MTSTVHTVFDARPFVLALGWPIWFDTGRGNAVPSAADVDTVDRADAAGRPLDTAVTAMLAAERCWPAPTSTSGRREVNGSVPGARSPGAKFDTPTLYQPGRR